MKEKAVFFFRKDTNQVSDDEKKFPAQRLWFITLLNDSNGPEIFLNNGLPFVLPGDELQSRPKNKNWSARNG